MTVSKYNISCGSQFLINNDPSLFVFVFCDTKAMHMIRYDLHENSKSDVQKNCSEVKQTEGTISTPIFMYDVDEHCALRQRSWKNYWKFREIPHFFMAKLTSGLFSKFLNFCN